MKKQLIYIFLLINLGHFVTTQCELTIAELEKIVLNPVWVSFRNSNNSLQGDTAIKFVQDNVRISAVQFNLLSHGNNQLTGVSSNTPPSQKMLNINLNFLLGFNQSNYKLMKSCTIQNIDGKNKTEGELQYGVGLNKYQIFTFSIYSQESSNGYMLMYKQLIFVFAFYIIYI